MQKENPKLKGRFRALVMASNFTIRILQPDTTQVIYYLGRHLPLVVQPGRQPEFAFVIAPRERAFPTQQILEQRIQA